MTRKTLWDQSGSSARSVQPFPAEENSDARLLNWHAFQFWVGNIADIGYSAKRTKNGPAPLQKRARGAARRSRGDQRSNFTSAKKLLQLLVVGKVPLPAIQKPWWAVRTWLVIPEPMPQLVLDCRVLVLTPTR